jgi:surfeit locus 1 family protein
MNARVGFYVVTPFQLAESLDVILVQRGWAGRHFQDRVELPPIATTDQQVEVFGRLLGPPARLFDMGGAESGPIRQNLDLKQMKASLRLNEQNLWIDVSVQQLGAPSEGLLREWPVIASGVDKHYGYAFQWFALSALIAGLFVWFAFFHHRLSHD